MPSSDDYDLLHTHLVKQKGDSCTLTFEEIERIIKDSLPPSAGKFRQWWENNTQNHTQAKAWMVVGWQVHTVNMKDGVVYFIRAWFCASGV